ncbi:MAG: plastocyanin/azurin family copper-binding protein [Ginsengibacter sp.]
MKTKNKINLLTTVLMIALITTSVLFFCSKSSGLYGTGVGNGGGNTPNSISIAYFSFSKTVLSVTTGTKVTWTNNDGAAHTVIADDGTFNSRQISPNSTFSYTFATKGNFPYHCSIHTMMKATVHVQ